MIWCFRALFALWGIWVWFTKTEYVYEVPKADLALRGLNSSSSPGYSHSTHCLSFSSTVLNHLAGSRSLPPWPPLCLCVCEGVLESLLGAAVQQQQQEAGLGGLWMREVGVVCLLAVQKGSSGPAPWPHVSGLASF